MQNQCKSSLYPLSMLMGLFVFILGSTCSQNTQTSQTICEDGRREVDVEKGAIAYDKYGITLSVGFKAITAAININPQKLQDAQESTQNWDQFIRGAGLAHNGCSGDKARYGILLSRYNDVKSAKENLDKLIDRAPNPLTDEYKQLLTSAFDKYYALLMSTKN